MKRAIIATLIAVSLTILPAASATAAPAKSFHNCTQLSKKYPGGVAKAGVTKNTVSHRKVAFKVKPKSSTALYKANKSLDRDKDGIACEK
jgi:hypothetical protein